ncbi:penicillin-binding protein 2 [Legionella israelensis]|uniref:penicillin-binding protein 2 n=1 Tax=Legionella israelensis TaxID=454 RepID=UPI00117E24A5|nr:penicillin-binding protein 2 [Legionella israelensis]QDP72752.1 penicillin-binding protein 2 [Legionella israelensis]
MRLSSTPKNRPSTQIQLFRLNLLIAILIILSLLLILRLAFLQISEFRHYQTLSLKNQVGIIPIDPPRGVIVDRNGIMLAENIPVYALEITPERVKNLKKTLNQLKTLIPSITDDDIEDFYRAKQQKRAFVPIPFKLKLNQEEVALFAVNQYRFPGVSIKARLMRHYPLGEITAHTVGYVGRINAQELKQVDTTNYRATNFIGKSGIEKYYEDILHGQVGYQRVETDVSGRTLRILDKQNPLSGAKLHLTIDARLQESAYQAIKNKRGAIVVIDTRNGDILAMVSSPSFDPNLFVSGISNKDYQQLISAKDQPMFNRAVKGTYAPASTIKPFIALAGLDSENITPTTSIYDPGSYKLPNSTHLYRDWKKRGHGMVNLKRAITVSCDTYFYRLGHKMGISVIEDMLTQFGFGQLSHVDLQGESAGVVPGASWKKITKGVSWYPGDTLITSIGQGFMLATPLQMANATAALGLHGHRYRPHLLNSVSNSDNGESKQLKPLEEYPVHVKSEQFWDVIADAMQNVILSKEGTGFRFGKLTDYTLAAKTGTAQVFSGRQYEKAKYQDIPEILRDNSLFIAFAPEKNPDIAIAVIVENDYIAPNVARKVLDTYFQIIKSNSTL